MSHSFNKIWIHSVWSTKERQPMIISSIESAVYQYMHSQFMGCGCIVRIINGMPEHVHCLFLLNAKTSIDEVIKQVKGGTSHYINQKDLTDVKFSWQTGYAAFSVSESVLEKAFVYIKNQKLHHCKKTFNHEYEEFLKISGLDK